MRELKIRIWDMDRKVMLGIQYVIFYNGDFYENYRDLEDGIPIENIVVMQSTGLKDKNGVGIFEKDIVKIEVDDGFDYIDSVGFVDWNEKEREYALFLKGEPWRRLSIEDEVEVIGNIYENPELLETKKRLTAAKLISPQKHL